jgi:XTP/dITP diphosphohydrolase
VRRLVLASRNNGKIKELQELLAGLPLEIVGMDDYPKAPEVAETGTTFADNAIIKAKAIAEFTNELTLADDSGLEVDYLSGEPGVYSARYGEPGWNDRQRYEYLLGKLNNVPFDLRQARFRSVVAIFDPLIDRVELAEGTVAGVIGNEPKGVNGFGYDPVFYLPEYQQTMAELPAEQKNDLSHRGRAIQAIIPLIYKMLA